jgi:hypothetical protein
VKPSDPLLTLLLLSSTDDSPVGPGEAAASHSHLRVLTLLLLILSGCSPPGSQAEARKYFDQEFHKWMAGQKTDVSTMNSRMGLLKPPIAYNIRSIVTTEPDYGAYQGDKLPEDWKTWPGYQFNVVIEWKSEANTPLEKVTAYKVTWNPHEKRWYATERF